MLKLTPITFDKFIEELDPYGKAVVEIDLRQVEFISSAILVQLAALCHSLHSFGKQITVKLNEKKYLYLMRAGFIPSIRQVAKIEPAEVEMAGYYQALQGLNRFLIEVKKLESINALPKLFDQILNTLRIRLNYSRREAIDTVNVISEVCQNIFEHNQGICGFIAMQVYKAGLKSFLEIGISDCGVGLRVSLKRNIKNKGIKSDLEAINFATKALTSEFDSPVRGTGLYHLLRVMKNHSGTVQIQSGKGKVRHRIDKIREWNLCPILRGVHVVLELDAKVLEGILYD